MSATPPRIQVPPRHVDANKWPDKDVEMYTIVTVGWINWLILKLRGGGIGASG